MEVIPHSKPVRGRDSTFIGKVWQTRDQEYIFAFWTWNNSGECIDIYKIKSSVLENPSWWKESSIAYYVDRKQATKIGAGIKCSSMEEGIAILGFQVVEEFSPYSKPNPYSRFIQIMEESRKDI